jgi:hypothetical protein
MAAYEVTLVARTVNDHDLQPPIEAPPGVSIEVAGPEVIITVAVEAANARSALAEAKLIARDFLLVLAASFSAYELVTDDRQKTRRTDAVYQADGDPPPLDVAEGCVTPYGVEVLDPTGELRRQGRVVTLRAAARVLHPLYQDGPRWQGRTSWPQRLRRAMALFHAAQCSTDEAVRFVLAMAALEVLAVPTPEELLAARLPAQDRAQLIKEVSGLLAARGLQVPDRERLLARLRDTQAIGSGAVLRTYLGGKGIEVTAADIQAWQKERGAYVHDGQISEDAEVRNQLVLDVGVCLQRELDTYVG